MKIRDLIFAFLLISTGIFSQDTVSTKNVNSLHKGSWAAQFEIGSDFKLSSFEGVLVSLKYHFSPKIALRFGVGFNGRNNQAKFEFKEYYYGYTGTEPYSTFKDNVFLILNCLYYVKHDSKINVFFGLGPRAGYIADYSEHVYLDGYKEIYDIESWAVGVNGVFGCEWFPVTYLSLFAEYSAYATVGKTITKDWVYEKSTGMRVEYYNTYSDDNEFKGNIAKLGLGIYF